jgi:hypothetical protein
VWYGIYCVNGYKRTWDKERKSYDDEQREREKERKIPAVVTIV